MSASANEERPFEETMAELERIVGALEDGQLGLDDALARYEEGVALVQLCHARLRQAEQRVLLVTRVEEDGQPALQPFQHEATLASSGRKPPARGAKPGGLRPPPADPETTL